MIKKGLTDDFQQTRLYDYSKYCMTATDKMLAMLVGFLGAAVVMHIFFGNIIVDVVIGVVCAFIAQPIYKNIKINSIKNQLTLQFKDMLDSLNSSVSAGKVIQAAFADAEKDMALQYGADSYICRELGIINSGLVNGVTVEELIRDFGERSGIEDISNFANVFMLSNRRGGNMKTIISESKSIICDKIEIEQEIKAMSSSVKSELYIMMMMPLLVVPLIGGFVQDGANDILNIIVKIVGLGMFIAAFVIGNKITDIKL